MLSFITGLPGSGKTLFTIQHVEKYRREELDRMQKEDPDAKLRPVYQFGINELKLDWQELPDVKEWFKCPEGSIIVVDEAQQHFPPMANGAKRPDHYLKFDVHRHSGYDIFLITQDAANVDIRVKSMAGRHYHHNRSYGLESSTLYEWQSVHKTDEWMLKKDRDAVKRQFSFPKEVYAQYKSAKVHTHKRQLPMKKIVPIVGLFIALIALVVFFASWLTNKEEQAYAITEQPEQPGVFDALARKVGTGSPLDDPSRFVPAIKNMPMSAPVYAEAVKILAVPRVDGCMSVRFERQTMCRCNDQQGNRVDVTTAYCEGYIADGYFDFTVADRREEREPQQQEYNTDTFN